MSDHAHHHHGHDHEEHSHGMSVYEFLGNILAFPLDETLLFNVCDPQFWADMRGRLENERTHDALDHLQEAAAVLAEIPADMRKMTLDAEYGKAFLGKDPWMPPLERDYGMDNGDVRDIARELGVEASLMSIIPADHIANELFMLVPLDGMPEASGDQLIKLAQFFEKHPMSLLRHMIEHPAPGAEGSGFYRAIVEFAAAWLQWDLDAFNG